MQSKYEQSFVVVFHAVFQIPVKMSHRQRHNDGQFKVIDALAVDWERHDVRVRIFSLSQQIDTSNEHAEERVADGYVNIPLACHKDTTGPKSHDEVVDAHRD